MNGSKKRLSDVLVAREEFDLDRLVEEAPLIEQVEANKGAGELFKFDKGLA